MMKLLLVGLGLIGVGLGLVVFTHHNPALLFTLGVICALVAVLHLRHLFVLLYPQFSQRVPLNFERGVAANLCPVFEPDNRKADNDDQQH